MIELTPRTVYEILKEYFPVQNDDYAYDYSEELQELNDFGIKSKHQLREMLDRRTYEILEIDRSPMNDSEVQMHYEDLGKAYVQNRLRNGFWFVYPGLLRLALELEYGEEYREYARKRDSVE